MNNLWESVSNASTSATAAVGTMLQSIGSQASGMASAAARIATVAGGPAALTQDLAAVGKPVSAAAKVAASSPLITGTARFLSKALPITAVVASSVRGAQIVQRDGAHALIDTRSGRDATLGAVGGALFLVPAPPTQVAAAGVLGVAAANHFGALDFLNAQPTALTKQLRPAVIHGATPLP